MDEKKVSDSIKQSYINFDNYSFNKLINNSYSSIIKFYKYIKINIEEYNIDEFNIAKKITKEDLYNALEKYKENDEVKNRDENESLKNYVLNTMYC